MNKLILPVAIFVSVLAVGKACEHYQMSTNWKIGVLCVVAMVVQTVVNRIQRARQAAAAKP